MASNRAALLGCSLLSLLSVSGCADFDMSKAMPLIRIEGNLPLAGNTAVSSSNSAGFQSSQTESWTDGSVVASDLAVLKVIPVDSSNGFHHGTVTVLNAEILDGGFVRVNMIFDSSTRYSQYEYAVMSIDKPLSNTFILDELGRQYPMVSSVGISPENVVKIKEGGIANFSIIFNVKNRIKKLGLYVTIRSSSIVNSQIYDDKIMRVKLGNKIDL